MTLVLIVLHPDRSAVVRVVVTAVAIIGFIVERIRSDYRFWFIIAALLLGGALSGWSVSDNHRYLMAYWALAISLALNADNWERVLSLSARRMIGLCFLFACIWKTITPDFLDGTFFHYSLLTDSRFREVAHWIGGINAPMADLNRAARAALFRFDSNLVAVQFYDPATIQTIAHALTWWTIGIESAIAIVFLLPLRNAFTCIRDVVLLVFSITTYALAPVIGFGWVLLIMGMIQVEWRKKSVRWMYVGTFVLLELYLLPWKKALSLLQS